MQCLFDPFILLAEPAEDVRVGHVPVEVSEHAKENFKLLWCASFTEQLDEFKHGSLVDDFAVKELRCSDIADDAHCLYPMVADQTLSCERQEFAGMIAQQVTQVARSTEELADGVNVVSMKHRSHRLFRKKLPPVYVAVVDWREMLEDALSAFTQHLGFEVEAVVDLDAVAQTNEACLHVHCCSC